MQSLKPRLVPSVKPPTLPFEFTSREELAVGSLLVVEDEEQRIDIHLGIPHWFIEQVQRLLGVVCGGNVSGLGNVSCGSVEVHPKRDIGLA